MQYKKGSKLGEMGIRDKRHSAVKTEFYNLNLQIKNPEPNTRQKINISIENVPVDNKQPYQDQMKIIETGEWANEQERTQKFISQRLPS